MMEDVGQAVLGSYYNVIKNHGHGPLAMAIIANITSVCDFINNIDQEVSDKDMLRKNKAKSVLAPSLATQIVEQTHSLGKSALVLMSAVGVVGFIAWNRQRRQGEVPRPGILKEADGSPSTYGAL